MKFKVLWIAGLMLAATVGQVQAGAVYASLSASPSSISEGQNTTLSLSLYHSASPVPPTSPLYWSHVNGYQEYFSGYGGMGNINATLASGNGQSFGINDYAWGNSYYETSRTVQYNQPGTYTASLIGTVQASEQIWHQNWERSYFSSWRSSYYYGEHRTGGYYTTPYQHSASITASTQINVGNLNPWITGINWNPFLTLGETLAYSVTATDPAGIANNEVITIAYDFDGNGSYESSQSGSLTSGGNYLFTTAGHHTVGVQVSDGLGGYGYASFGVDVLAAPVPEPASLAMWGISALGLVFARRRRQQIKLAA